MGNIIYLTVNGERQGAISDGCGTEASTGNRWQIGHENEIFAFSLSNSITSTSKGCQLHGLRFSKLIDKCTPLLSDSINNNEQLFMEFYFYRINKFGRWEKYYFIQLRGAFLSDIRYQFTENTFHTKTITVNYEYILCQHLIANTEFSYLALPADYNRLYIPRPKVNTDKGLQTLNSKAVGRLLAAGGVYNGNIEGFRKTAEKLGGDAIKGYDQVLNKKTAGTVIAAASILMIKNPSSQMFHNLNGYVGKIRGEEKLMQGLDVKRINYIKRERAETSFLRKEFNNSIRKQFLKRLSVTTGISRYFDSSEISYMAKGIPPRGWEVHHRLPLDDGGNNSFENLTLIEKEPFHKILTNYQRIATKGMQSGDSKFIPWIVPKDSVYQLKKKVELK